MKTKENLMVGYLQSWSDITFTAAAKKGYTAIVMGFGTITGADIGIVDGVFRPSPSDTLLIEDIENAKKNGAKEVLFSVGGQNNTYNPRGASVSDVAKKLVPYIKKYGFTGIDFDLEIDTDSTYLDSLCEAIKTLDSNLTITAAPQLNQDAHESNLFCVSTLNYRIYDKAIQNKRFDYLFIQAYNNQWPLLDGYSQSNVEFIISSFHNLKTSIPESTLIVIGEPADEKGAGFCIFQNNTKGDEIYSDIASQYSSIHKDTQFGGAMVWSINIDAQNDYRFIDSVKDIIN